MTGENPSGRSRIVLTVMSVSRDPQRHVSTSLGRIAELADGSAVGAWMLKANPAIWDIGAAIEQRLRIDWWRLAHTYRAELVRDGQPCLLWVTRGDRRVASGIWGFGSIVGEVEYGSGDPDDALWVDDTARDEVRPRTAVDMTILDEPLTVEELRSDPRLANLEVLRVPRIGNPAAVAPTEWAVIRSLLP